MDAFKLIENKRQLRLFIRVLQNLTDSGFGNYNVKSIPEILEARLKELEEMNLDELDR